MTGAQYLGAWLITIGLVAGFAWAMIHARSAGYSYGERDGRCIELCRPEKFIQPVNQATECLCTKRRVKLEKAP